MKIRNVEVPVNILGELEPYLDRFRDYKIRVDKLQSCSPFRFERHGSFAVHLETGVWVDSGAASSNYYKGNFVSLLAYLRQEEYIDTEEYLLTAYHVMLENTDRLKLDMELSLDTPKPVTFDWFKDFPHLQFRHPYLARRGISEEIQRFFCVGFDKERDAVAMPWFNNDKKVINVKYRSIRYKQFFYEPTGQLTRYYVFGLQQCMFKKCTTVAIVESEIDCMYLWSNGIPSVAMGHAGINKEQIKLLLDAGIESVILAMDNDDAGWRFKEEAIRKLSKHFLLWDLNIPPCYKDVNEIPSKVLIRLHEQRTIINYDFLSK